MLIFWLLLSILVQISFLVFLVLHIHDQLATQAPFVPLPKAVLPSVSSALSLTPTSIVYDLGCGDARVLRHLAKEYPQAEFIGIEKGFIPYFIARVATRSSNNIRIERKDMQDTNLKEATHIFTYLFPEIMQKMLPKFNAELSSGARLVTVDFTLSGKKPLEEIPLHRDKRSIAQTIIVYEF